MERKQLSKGTYKLETTNRGTSYDGKRKWLRERNLLPRDHRGRDKSGHEKKATKQQAPTNWRPKSGDKSGAQKKVTEKVVLTNWSPQEGGTSQGMEKSN
jgi:hypothetical protein